MERGLLRLPASMAYLNVRERRLETKIAYVGAPLSGRATNFERLGGGELGGDVLGLYWEPNADTTFRDCDIRVHLVTSRGSPSGEQIVDLLRDADGVVFVADAAPDAQERNRLSLALVREALSTQRHREVPVIVQRNKSDLADAVSAEAIAAGLELGDWPQVTAAASLGAGVVETVELALAGVLEQLRKTPGNDTSASPAAGETARPAAPRAATREGNPLLTALRQVLRETVTAEVDELELRLGGRLERLFARADGETAALLREVLDDHAKVRFVLEMAREQAELNQATTTAANAQLAAAVRDLGAELSSQRSELTAVRERLAAVDTRTEEMATLRERVDAIRDSVGAAQMAVRLSATEVTRALEASTRAERDQIGTAATQIKRAVEALSVDVRGADARLALAPLQASLEAMGAQTDSLATTVRPLTTLAARLDQVENLLKREVRLGVETVSSKVDVGRDTSVLAIAEAGQKTIEVHALLEAVVEELKKPKKSWFT